MRIFTDLRIELTSSEFLMSSLFNLCFAPQISPQTHVEMASLSEKYWKGQSGCMSCHAPNSKYTQFDTFVS